MIAKLNPLFIGKADHILIAIAGFGDQFAVGNSDLSAIEGIDGPAAFAAPLIENGIFDDQAFGS